MAERWILFDAVGTVIHPEPTATIVYQQVAAKRGLALSAEEIERRFRIALKVHFAPEATAQDPWWTSELRKRQRWQDIVSDTLFEIVEMESAADGRSRELTCFEELWRHFSEPTHWRMDPSLPIVWKQLRSLGYRLAIASNFDSRLESICHGMAPLNSADHLFHSAFLRTRKPGLSFFRAIEATLGIGSGGATLVGDDWENDYQAATRAGWQAFWLSRQAILASAASVLANLSELPQRLQLATQQHQQ